MYILPRQETELPINVEVAEQHYNATYVGDFCLKHSTEGWDNNVVAVFYQETPPQPDYSHYFAIRIREGHAYIMSGASAVAEPIEAIVARNGEVVYSRCRWDYRTSKDGSVSIDGGRDYTRLVGDASINAKRVLLKVNGPNIEVHDVE